VDIRSFLVQFFIINVKHRYIHASIRHQLAVYHRIHRLRTLVLYFNTQDILQEQFMREITRENLTSIEIVEIDLERPTG
jgi:hypothetical protein